LTDSSPAPLPKTGLYIYAPVSGVSKSRGKARAVVKEEKKEPAAIKAEPVVEDIGRKRSFSYLNREYDEELVLVSEGLARTEGENRLLRLENAAQEASSGSEEPAQEARGGGIGRNRLWKPAVGGRLNRLRKPALEGGPVKDSWKCLAGL